MQSCNLVRMQVELNTISSSFGCLCTLVVQMHRYIMEHQGASQQVGVLCLITAMTRGADVQHRDMYICSYTWE